MYKKVLTLLKTNRFIGNTNWLIFQNIYSMLLSLVVGALSARYLEPANYGLIGYGTSLVNLFTSVSQLGLDSVLLNEIVTHPKEKGKFIGTAVCMRLPASILSFCCILVMVFIIEPGNQLLWAITALQAFAVILRGYELLNEWFLSELNSKQYVVANMLGQTAVAIWRLVLIALGATVFWFAASTTVQAVVCGCVIVGIFVKSKDFKLSFSFDTAKYLFGKSKHYVVAGLAVSLYTQMDKVMVGKMLGETEVGYYTAAMTIAMLWEFIPQAIINSSRAVILDEKVNNEERYRKKLKLLFFFISVMGIAVGIAVQIFGGLAVYILYGEQYMEAVPVLQLLIWSTTFAMLGVARNIWSLAEDKNRYSKNYTICGSIVNLVFNALTIPVWGIQGAASSTLLAEIVVALISPLIWKDTRPFVSFYFSSWKEGIQLVRKYLRR